VSLTDHQLTRLAAALWNRVDQVTTYHHLAWADDLLGPGGRDRLWADLQRSDALLDEQLQPQALARYLAQGQAEAAALLWTLPPGLIAQGQTYLDGLTSVVHGAQRELLLMTPFLQVGGVHLLQRELQDALYRGVSITMISHDLHDIKSPQSQALETLRREAERMAASFKAYAAQPQSGLLHAKLVVADRERVVLGSANMTGYGLSMNFEVGVILGSPYAEQVASMYEQLLRSSVVQHVFTTQLHRKTLR